VDLERLKAENSVEDVACRLDLQGHAKGFGVLRVNLEAQVSTRHLTSLSTAMGSSAGSAAHRATSSRLCNWRESRPLRTRSNGSKAVA
jgi:hypothetical protein